MNTDIEIDEEEYSMPGSEALLACTLALMTGHAQACSDSQRQLIAQKISHHLSQLAAHPLLSPQFRSMLWNLHQRWQLQLTQGQIQQPSQEDRQLWHAGTTSVQ